MNKLRQIPKKGNRVRILGSRPEIKISTGETDIDGNLLVYSIDPNPLAGAGHYGETKSWPDKYWEAV